MRQSHWFIAFVLAKWPCMPSIRGSADGGGNARDAHERAPMGALIRRESSMTLVASARCHHATAEVDEGSPGLVDGRGSSFEVGRVDVRLLCLAQRGRPSRRGPPDADVGGMSTRTGPLRPEFASTKALRMVSAGAKTSRTIVVLGDGQRDARDVNSWKASVPIMPLPTLPVMATRGTESR